MQDAHIKWDSLLSIGTLAGIPIWLTRRLFKCRIRQIYIVVRHLPFLLFRTYLSFVPIFWGKSL